MIEIASLEVVDSMSNIWPLVILPVGIAVIGLAGTLGVTALQLNARRKELQDERDERVALAAEAERLRVVEARADAVEQIVSEIAQFAHTLSAEIKRLESEGYPSETKVTYPSNFSVKRAISRLTTRASERRLTDAALTFLRDAGSLSLNEQPFVYGILQERLEYWFTGERSLDETINALAEDGAGFRAGQLPPQVD